MSGKLNRTASMWNISYAIQIESTFCLRALFSCISCVVLAVGGVAQASSSSPPPSDYKFILLIINYMLNLIRNLFHFNGFESAKLDLTLSVIEFSANSPARKYLLEIEGKPRIEWETRDDFSRREISNWQAQCNGGEWIKFTLQNSMHKTGKLIFPLDSLTL